MTYDCGKLKTGDKGQQFEVRAQWPDGEERPIGWTATRADAERMAAGIKLHPGFSDPKIIDRQAGE